MLINELQDGAEIDLALAVRDVERRSRKDGGDYLRLRLGDKSGAVAAMVWDDVDGVAEIATPGEVVRVVGRYTVHPRFGPQISLRGLQRPAPGSWSAQDLFDGPPRSALAMEQDLRDLLATVSNPYLQQLLQRILGETSALWERYKVAPAAKVYHQAYRHGLLEHSLTVAQAVGAISGTFPQIDRDVAVTGALLHDIGKLDAYNDDRNAIDLTGLGRLQGEIPLGYYLVRREIEDIDGFPQDLACHVLHIILSHHGSLEHGSPVLPATREATLVHMIDNLGGKLGSFDRLQKALSPGQSWSQFDRALGGSAYFPVPSAEEEVAAVEDPRLPDADLLSSVGDPRLPDADPLSPVEDPRLPDVDPRLPDADLLSPVGEPALPQGIAERQAA